MLRLTAKYLLLSAVCLVGCASKPSAPAEPDSSTLAKGDNAERTIVIGRSVEGRPIEMHLFGDGPHPILILGGIHGNEQNSSQCATLLLDHIRRHRTDFSGSSIAIIPAANPDGLARGVRFNARRVDLNRNFPATNWAKAYSSGPTPASEPETRALVALLADLKPRRILSIHSITNAPCNNYDGPAEILASAMSAQNGYPPKDSIGYVTPGSLGTWAGVDRKIPIITLELPFSLPGPACWERNRSALLTFARAAD